MLYSDFLAQSIALYDTEFSQNYSDSIWFLRLGIVLKLNK